MTEVYCSYCAYNESSFLRLNVGGILDFLLYIHLHTLLYTHRLILSRFTCGGQLLPLNWKRFCSGIAHPDSPCHWTLFFFAFSMALSCIICGHSLTRPCCQCVKWCTLNCVEEDVTAHCVPSSDIVIVILVCCCQCP